MNARFNLYKRSKNSLRERALVQPCSTKRPFKQSASRTRRGVCLDAPRSLFSFISAQFRPLPLKPQASGLKSSHSTSFNLTQPHPPFQPSRIHIETKSCSPAESRTSPWRGGRSRFGPLYHRRPRITGCAGRSEGDRQPLHQRAPRKNVPNVRSKIMRSSSREMCLT
jgi:hypothetical protein